MNNPAPTPTPTCQNLVMRDAGDNVWIEPCGAVAVKEHEPMEVALADLGDLHFEIHLTYDVCLHCLTAAAFENHWEHSAFVLYSARRGKA